MSGVPGWLDEAVERIATSGAGRFAGAGPAPSDARPCAVLVLFSPDTGVEDPADSRVLLTRRSHTLRSHAGQVSFPGGMIDPDDDGPAAAARREAWEETGLEPETVDVVGMLPPVCVAHSGNLVTPVVGWSSAPSSVGVVDPAEVASVHWVSVDHLLDPANRFRVRHPSGMLGPGFAIPGDPHDPADTAELLVWGFTGGILDRFFSLAGWARPWNSAVVADLVDAARADRRARRIGKTPGVA